MKQLQQRVIIINCLSPTPPPCQLVSFRMFLRLLLFFLLRPVALGDPYPAAPSTTVPAIRHDLLNEDGTLKTDRPVIQSVSPNEIRPGDGVEVATDGDIDQGASIIRYGSATHTVNTDQRRIGVKLTKNGSNKYKSQVPVVAGIAQPRYYMLFVLRNGVPSHSVNI